MDEARNSRGVRSPVVVVAQEECRGRERCTLCTRLCGCCSEDCVNEACSSITIQLIEDVQTRRIEVCTEREDRLGRVVCLCCLRVAIELGEERGETCAPDSSECRR